MFHPSLVVRGLMYGMDCDHCTNALHRECPSRYHPTTPCQMCITKRIECTWRPIGRVEEVRASSKGRDGGKAKEGSRTQDRIPTPRSLTNRPNPHPQQDRIILNPPRWETEPALPMTLPPKPNTNTSTSTSKTESSSTSTSTRDESEVRMNGSSSGSAVGGESLIEVGSGSGSGSGSMSSGLSEMWDQDEDDGVEDDQSYNDATYGTRRQSRSRKRKPSSSSSLHAHTHESNIAPRGYTKDGRPKQKPGRKPNSSSEGSIISRDDEDFATGVRAPATAVATEPNPSIPFSAACFITAQHTSTRASSISSFMDSPTSASASKYATWKYSVAVVNMATSTSGRSVSSTLVGSSRSGGSERRAQDDDRENSDQEEGEDEGPKQKKRKVGKGVMNPWSEGEHAALWQAIYECAKANVKTFTSLPIMQENNRCQAKIHTKLNGLFRKDPFEGERFDRS